MHSANFHTRFNDLYFLPTFFQIFINFTENVLGELFHLQARLAFSPQVSCVLYFREANYV
jgi:hypothetical protein